MKNRALLSILALMILASFNASNVQTIAKTLYNPEANLTVADKKFNEVRASHILVSTKEEAETLRQEIVSGKVDFADAAKECSKCPSGQQGGDLGFFSRGMMVPAFERVAFTLPVGQISEPVKTEFGWHLIVVTERR